MGDTRGASPGVLSQRRVFVLFERENWLKENFLQACVAGTISLSVEIQRLVFAVAILFWSLIGLFSFGRREFPAKQCRR